MIERERGAVSGEPDQYNDRAVEEQCGLSELSPTLKRVPRTRFSSLCVLFVSSERFTTPSHRVPESLKISDALRGASANAN